MKWVTREGAKTDRVACPWLIRKFIDPSAEFLFVPKEQVLAVAAREGGKSFDCPGADYTHKDGKCSFEALVDAHHLTDPALHLLARIVHGADVAADVGIVPEAAGLLIVDDEPSAVRLVERMVQGGGRAYRFFRAYSGQEALARARAQRPGAIVLDLAMPNGDGAWLLSALRQDPCLANLPVIVVTARPVEEIWQSGPIGILSSAGFTPTEALRHLQALLSAVPPATGLPHGP